MRIFLVVVPALLLAGAAVAQAGRPSPAEPQAKVPPVGFRSALEGYRPFADQNLADWRKANEEAGAAGRHTSKPQPGKPESRK